MLLMLIAAFLSTRAFFRTAREAGKHPGKAASTPFVGLGVALIASYTIDSLLLNLFETINLFETAEFAIGFMCNLFLTAAYLVFSRENYRSLNSLSEKPSCP